MECEEVVDYVARHTQRVADGGDVFGPALMNSDTSVMRHEKDLHSLINFAEDYPEWQCSRSVATYLRNHRDDHAVSGHTHLSESHNSVYGRAHSVMHGLALSNSVVVVGNRP